MLSLILIRYKKAIISGELRFGHSAIEKKRLSCSGFIHPMPDDRIYDRPANT
ncbi:MAG: hypothetical protein GXO77_00230 [Calditrichaeota bacterium]|nr:hypothetical protein [Calditrichota bacterium]